jgi:Response regulators consisting of a CheY-like receiver domain and a winged-helix DNA-binding domain
MRTDEVRRRVLVVEDERTIAESVAVRLRAEGFTVDLAHDGPTAVATATTARPDLVVLDVICPASTDWRCVDASRRNERYRFSC